MTRALAPLTMSSIEALPARCRACVAWEIAGPVAAMSAEDRAFEKEVWLSGVMLSWGSAGMLVSVAEQAAGFALYAPPTAVPAALALPTSPVSADAVLLTVLRIGAEFTGQGLARYLMNGVVGTLTRRGVRAIEAFGVEETEGSDDPGSTGVDEGTKVPGCLIPAGFLRAVGFTEIRPHHRYPRLRFELASGLGWKADVEAALEKLFTVITVPAPEVAAPALAGSRR